LHRRPAASWRRRIGRVAGQSARLALDAAALDLAYMPSQVTMHAEALTIVDTRLAVACVVTGLFALSSAS
jgi:hypothetical protein